MAFYFQIKALLPLKCTVTPKFSFFDTKRTPHSFKPRKNIPVLGGNTFRKPEYLEMRRTYSQ